MQEESYEAQATYYENKIKNTPGWDFVGVYGERESGTHAENRDEFQRMIQDALARKIDLIINNPDGTPHYENTVQYAILKREWMERK